MSTVLTRSFAAPPVDRAEILRYAAARGCDDPALRALVDECLCEVEGVLCYKLCCCELPLIEREGEIALGTLKSSSATLKRALSGCERVLLFAATVGFGIDRAIARYGTLSPAKALCLQAIGAERIEALCDLFCREMSEELAAKGLLLRPRVSPGYGDLPLAMQREIFALLDPARRVGITLNDSLLMSPSKSVTALAGIAPKNT